MNKDNEVLVKVDGVSKIFCRDFKKSLLYGLADSARDLLSWGKSGEAASSHSTFNIQHSTFKQRELRQGEFYAVKDVSFELRRGECLGLIGRNGAGKTTLLKMLNGLIKPDSGRIEMRGRIGALIALGSGFNPVLTGRENIYVNGSVLGLSKEEIEAKIDEIIDFAEIREFIDSPVQTYSSGMQVRLGFAVATAMEPDVLILDEVLAVGDAAFRAKCYNRVVSLRKKSAVIFVTHAMEQVARICDRSLLMTRGKCEYIGDVGGGIDRYDQLNELGIEQDPSFLSLQPPLTGFEIKNIPEVARFGEPLKLDFEIATTQALSDFRLRLSFYNASGMIVAEVNQASHDNQIHLNAGSNSLSLVMQHVPLKSGKYRMGCAIIDNDGDLIAWSYKQFSIDLEGAKIVANTDCQIPVSSWCHHS